MKLYADLPLRRARQVVGDLAVVLWTWLWFEVGGAVRDATLQLADPGRRIDRSATDLAVRLRDAGESVSGIPLVGEEVRSPFDEAGGAAEGIASAGRDQVAAVESLAQWLGVVVVAVPVALVLLLWLPRRIRFVRRATAGQRFLDARADLDLFALRAMAHQPLHVLARVDDDPAGAWRRGDARVVETLARLELRAVGLRPPRAADRRAGRAAT